VTVHAASPVYQFSFSNVMIPSANWPTGGVGGMYVEAIDNDGVVVTPIRGVDPDDSENSFWPDNRYVSTYPTPDNDSPQPAYLNSPMGTANVHTKYGTAEYVLNDFLVNDMSRFFPMGNPNPGAFVQYYNAGELGLGRVVGCTRGTFTVLSPTNLNLKVKRNGTACYVNEYAPLDGSGKPVYGNQAGALAALGTTAISTSFIVVFDNTAKGATSGEAWFGSFVRDSSGDVTRTATTAFDFTGHNSMVPNNCLTCHGGTAAVNTDKASDSRAYLLPLDLSSLAFGPDTQAQQADSLRQINAWVAATNPTPAIADFVNGSYHGAANTPGTAFDPTYVPAGWSVTPAQTKVYNQVIKPYCKACHGSQLMANGGIDFLKSNDAEAMRALIVADVCKTHRMPHAQQTMLRFWGSGARAQLLGFFGRRDFDGQSCTP
jgi:hypothetical protein